MIIDTTITAKDYADMVGEFAQDLTDALLVLQESTFQAAVKALENGQPAPNLIADANVEEMEIVIEKLDPKKKIAGRSVKAPLDRLKKRYNWDGGSVSDLFGKIYRKQNAKTLKKAASVLSRSWPKELRPPTPNQIVANSPLDVGSVTNRGQAIPKTLARRLEKEVREVLAERNLIATRGRTAGQISQGAVADIQARWQKVFQSYTRPPAGFKNPAMVDALVNTEVRRIVNTARETTGKIVEKQNPDKVIWKTWIHNPHLSKTQPRDNHAAMNGQTVKRDELFRLTAATGGVYHVKQPQDATLPAGEVINCHCDVLYRVGNKNE